MFSMILTLKFIFFVLRHLFLLSSKKEKTNKQTNKKIHLVFFLFVSLETITNLLFALKAEKFRSSSVHISLYLLLSSSSLEGNYKLIYRSISQMYLHSELF